MTIDWLAIVIVTIVNPVFFYSQMLIRHNYIDTILRYSGVYVRGDLVGSKKPIGYGSISLLLLLFGFLFNIPLQNDFKISYLLFNILNLDIYSNGDVGIHYPVVASIIF